MFINENQIGVIMCGGQSLRMGQDKGMILQGNVTWAQLAYQKLQSIGLPVVVSINESQLLQYSEVFAKEDLVIDSVGIRGPLGGLLSVHSRFPNADLMILACDLLDMGVSSIQHLYNYVADQGSEYDFVVYKNQQQFTEPLLGLYTSEGLNKIYKYHLGQMLEKTSMKHVLEIGNTFLLDFPNDNLEFNNYNTFTVM